MRLILAVLAACSAPADRRANHTPIQHASPPPPGLPEGTHAFSQDDAWHDPQIGCVRQGPARDVDGVIHVRPLGKGVDGTLLELDTHELWVVAYRATDQHRALAGTRVRAHGHACDKQGASVLRPHFDIETITVSVETITVSGSRSTSANCYPYARRDGRCLARCEFYAPGDSGCAKSEWPLICNTDGTCTPEIPHR